MSDNGITLIFATTALAIVCGALGVPVRPWAYLDGALMFVGAVLWGLGEFSESRRSRKYPR